MIRTIYEYKLNLFCVCLGCKHKKIRNDATRYCKAHPQKLPPEIWNGKNVDCPFFEPIQQESDENQSDEIEKPIKKGEKKHGMKKFSDLIEKK